MAEQERPNVRRRSSFGRALERVRDALKRRRSRGAEGVLLQSTREDETTTATTTVPSGQPPAEQQEARRPDQGIVTEPEAVVPGESTADSQLVPDDGVTDDDTANEEPLIPAFANRLGVDEEKAKALFERYGLKYQPRRPVQASSSDQPAGKIRRVEKPIRMRIHWRCHECDNQFGHERVCWTCGHRRCAECQRSPPKRVKTMLDEAAQAQAEQQQTAANTAQILTAIAPNTVASPAAISDAPPTDATLEADDKEETAPLPEYTMEQRPRSGIKLVMRSKAPTMQRICHECLTPFASRTAADCQNCGHQRCNACPLRSTKFTEEGEKAFEPTMVATVQRVYRKPRQRVRWTCEKCEAIILDSQRCRACNHQRCESCVRSPAKRTPRQPDPAILQSVSDKLAAFERSRAQRGLASS